MNELLRGLVEENRLDEAWRVLHDRIRNTDDFREFTALSRWRKRLASASAPTFARTVKVALLSGATTDLLAEPLQMAIEATGLGCELYRSDFNTFAQEMLDRESGAVSFGPDVAVVVNTTANLPVWPDRGDTVERVGKIVDEACQHWLDLCKRLHDHTACEIVLNNFHMLPTSPLGNLGSKTPWDGNTYLRRLNLVLGERAPSYVHINDVEMLAARYGISGWFDVRYWYHARQPVTLQCTPAYVRSIARIMGALYGYDHPALRSELWGRTLRNPLGLAAGFDKDGILAGPLIQRI